MGRVEHMKLDRRKYLAEVARTRASLETDEVSKRAALQQAASIYKERYEAGKKYYADSNHLKGLDVQKSSMQGLGNVLIALADSEGAEEAFSEALVQAELLLELDPSNATRRQRGVAISLYSLARLTGQRDTQLALTQLNRAVEISRSVLSLEATNVRRPRGLALTLALRGEYLIKQGTDVQAGIDDYREASKLLTRRAVESPRELVSQQDLEGTITTIADTLEEAEQHAVSSEILMLTIDQLECIAGAEELAGRGEWNDILNRLRDRSDAVAVILLN
jgi:tetratricopeptide (TPR) repeat protein